MDIHGTSPRDSETGEDLGAARSGGVEQDPAGAAALGDMLGDLEEAHRIAQLGLCTWMPATGEIRWSAELFHIAGRAAEGFLSTLDDTLAAIHPEDRERAKRRLDQAVADRQPFDDEFRIVRPDGEKRICWARVRPIVEQGRTAAVRIILVDLTEKREVERALEASLDHYRYTLELNPQIPWTADADGNIVDVGARWGELIDSPTGHWTGAVHPDDVEPTLADWERSLATGESIDLNYRLRLRSGGYNWFRVRAQARRDEEGRIARWYGLLEDIDEQVAAEHALGQTEHWLQTAHDAAGIGLFEVDLENGIGRMNPRGMMLHGLPPDSQYLFHGRDSWAKLLHPDDIERTWSALTRAVETGEPYDVVFRVPREDGGMRWIHGLGRVQYDSAGGPTRVLGINIDVSAHMEAEERLEQSEALNRTIVEASPDSIKLIDANGIVLFANDGSRAALDLDEPDSLVGQPWLSFWPAGAQTRARDALAAAMAGGIGRFTAARAGDGGKPKWWDVVVSPALGEDGSPRRLVSIARDITQQKTAEDQIHWSATHDALTHLPNRRLFEDRLAEAIDEAEVSGRCVGLIAIDLDRFKQVNDTLGHDAGNAILRTVADRLRASIRPTDLAARLGGDEFAIIVPNIEGGDGLTVVADRILATLREPVVYAGHTLDCRASLGASMYPYDGIVAADVLKHADLALYSSKASHHDGLLMFEPRMRAELQQRVSMIRIARDALEEDRLCAFYQPKVNFVSGAVIGFEALARLQDSRGGMRPPATIQAAFEDFDVATAITDRMLERVTGDMRRWIDEGINFGHVAINASAPDFRRDGFAERVIGALDRAGVPARKLQLEVTETVFLGRGADYVERALKRLNQEGIKIALDDFGTGYASLSHLKQFPVDLIKIDRSFVSDLHDECGDEAIVEAVVHLGRSLRIEVVAEGVETDAQAVRLRRLGCKFGQGFLYSEAVPARHVPAMVARKFPRSSPKAIAPRPPRRVPKRRAF